MAEAMSLDWMGQETTPALAMRLAELYDLDVQDRTEDLDFYRAMARRTGGPILELACGTGRVAIPLALDGHRVVGLDASAAQLDLARRKAAEAKVKLELVVGDMRDFTLTEPFRLIAIPFTSFLVLRAEDRFAALARVREHLAADGLFVLDVFQPDPEKIAGMQGAVVHNWTREDPNTGATVMKTSSSVADVDGVTFNNIYEEIDVRGKSRRYVRTARLHYLYRRELELLLTASGLDIEAVYGSYGLEPATAASPRLIAVARRRERRDEVGERRRR